MTVQSAQLIKDPERLLKAVPQQRDNRRAVVRMNAFIREYERQCGNISATCMATGVTRGTYYAWMKGEASCHKRFQRKILKTLPRERLKDAAESVILHHLSRNDLTAAIFTAKTIAADRGWSDRPHIIVPQALQNAQVDESLQTLKKLITQRANEKGVAFEDELAFVSEHYGSVFKRDLIDQLISGTIQ